MGVLYEATVCQMLYTTFNILYQVCMLILIYIDNIALPLQRSTLLQYFCIFLLLSPPPRSIFKCITHEYNPPPPQPSLCAFYFRCARFYFSCLLSLVCIHSTSTSLPLNLTGLIQYTLAHQASAASGELPFGLVSVTLKLQNIFGTYTSEWRG